MNKEDKKPLVIKVQPKSVPLGDKFEWSSLTGQMSTFTRDIIIPDIAMDKDGNSSVNIGAIVSGMPTIFARANLFKLALDYRPDKDAETDGIMSYYKSLIDEWRGLLACIALDYSRLEIERVELKYSDNTSVAKTSNIYEPKGAFGNLLFDRKPLWCDQELAPNEEKIPFIDVIMYQGKVVGATSPDSFLFSSVAYRINETRPFVSNGKFTDPLKSKLEEADIKSLYAYVGYVLKNVENFRRYFDNIPKNIQPQPNNILDNLEDWKKEIEEYAKDRHVKLEDASIPQIDIFKKPFSILFNYLDKLHGIEGVIYEEAQNNTIEFDLNQLLLSSENSDIARFDFGNEVAKNPALISKLPVFVLKAKCNGMSPDYYQYFALPLSSLGLNVFGKNIAALIGMNDNAAIHSRMTAEFDPDVNTEINNLHVTLKLKTQNGKEKVLERSYTVSTESIIHNNDILIWPNFISKQWKRYFMYSELPHNDSTHLFQATPIVGDVSDADFRICMHENNAVGLAEDGKISIPAAYQNSIIAKLHIVSDDRIADNRYKYEIYESNQPFKGVRLNSQRKESGYLIIRYGSASTGLPLNYLNDNKTLYPANLGIDFGSTNTSVAYYSKRDNKIMDEIKLKNRRISLLSNNNENSARPAMENEIFFFQKEEIRTNAIKSVLTIHDSKRIVKDDPTFAGQSIRVGFPCFEKNLPIDRVTPNRYELLYIRAGNVEMVYDMKWKTKEDESTYKKAYLSTLLLHIYAQMFIEDHFPENLKWAYPSSMSKNLVRQYSAIWSVLKNENPLVGNFDMQVYGPDKSEETEIKNPFEKSDINSPFSTNSFAANPFGETETGSLINDIPFSSKSTIINQLNEIKTEQNPIKFNFRQLRGDTALTEACAVANYIANSNIEKTQNNLTLCFDVGGSTTDISVLCQMQGGLAMIKQNSIRFAAQRLTSATKNSPNFESMLREFCNEKGLKLQGLNLGEPKFSKDIAPYYFEQLIDKLGDADFSEFYNCIHTKCPELMTVNLYVTGLIMFYAGQLTYKLIEEIKKSGERKEDWKTKINIVLAGKGARIFDWYKVVTDKNTSKDYFNKLFVEGLGGSSIAAQILLDWPDIISASDDTLSNVKYEVSKGLAYRTDTLLVPFEDQAIEILGEDGFVVDGKKIPYNNSITSEMMEVIEKRFWHDPEDPENPCPQFIKFAGIFYGKVKDLYQLEMSIEDFKDAFKNMKINSYIKNLPEFIEAVENKKDTFDFVAPIIILEGMKFYEDYLLKGIAKQQIQLR